ncbi:hypothetical protein OG564_45125 [Streptomyces sp. NBC_01280]|uniref:hypothetical protein n=1 Tax=unclassified Streptomyces TaxID=2593676 RepID=UPI002E36CD2B|nr:hypothetical protein [Streptomyces sp. NBC_01280]WSE12033.1 hypothetical protein OG518_01080 [Streptomyces sp. NBC_01397]WSE19593.1 hypothetical protein OG518_43360 [Streptomyces sp. NBC_01397]
MPPWCPQSPDRGHLFVAGNAAGVLAPWARGPALAPSRAYGPLSARRKRRTPSAALGSLVEASRTYGGELQVGISCSSGHALDLVIQETGIDDPEDRELLKRHPLRD